MRSIEFPEFIQCCDYITDQYWKVLFENLALNNPPYGTYIYKGYLCCNYKGKEFSYKIVKDNPEKMYLDLKEIFINKLSILSKDDFDKKKDNYKHIEKLKDIRTLQWSEIKKKTTKEFLLEIFVSNMKKKWNLTVIDSKRLLAGIVILIMFKIISNDDVMYDQGEILEISGITFREGGFSFENDISEIADISPTSIIVYKKNMIDNWGIYLSLISKEIFSKSSG